jgi:ribosomal-protein-alanine N-acetyltransferase
MNVDVDISQIVLRTPRLTLRPWRESDLEDLYEYASVDGVGQMAGWLPHKDREESKRVLRDFIDGKHTFALEYEGKVIGSLGIDRYNEANLPALQDQRGREIGYVLGRDYWGRGLMTEAVGAVIVYLFGEMKLDFIVCCHFTDNIRSQRVQEKCGFKHVRLMWAETRYGDRKEAWISVLTRPAS